MQFFELEVPTSVKHQIIPMHRMDGQDVKFITLDRTETLIDGNYDQIERASVLTRLT